MRATQAHYDQAKQEALHAGAKPKDLLDALQTINRLQETNAALVRNAAWARGGRGDGVSKIPGLTDTETALVRRFAACGAVFYADMDDLHRHKSSLTRKLKTIAPSVKIETLIGQGYEITQGFDELYRLLHAGKQPSLKAQGFTVKQTAILKHLVLRGSVHIDQMKCLQRHMSNIRSKLPKSVKIDTHPGEGLYTIAKGKEILERLLSGDAPAPTPPALSLVA